jgi:hypothetical protein
VRIPDVEALEKNIGPLDAEVFLLLKIEAGDARTRRIGSEVQTHLKRCAMLSAKNVPSSKRSIFRKDCLKSCDCRASVCITWIMTIRAAHCGRDPHE